MVYGIHIKMEEALDEKLLKSIIQRSVNTVRFVEKVSNVETS
jgi:hypothetical protein